MADETHGAPQFGRPTRRKSLGKAPKPVSGGGPPVGPVEGVPENAGAIIRSANPPAAHAPLARREPGAEDEKLRELVVFVARGLVDRPDDVSVEYLAVTPAETTLELRVHPDDLGHVIGKMGRTARSVRLALGAAASKLDRRAGLEIAD